MHRIHRSVLVPYTPEQMFALVRDVERYPQFLPWCPSASVHRVDNDPVCADTLDARVDIAYLGVRSHFRTRNRHDAPRSIELELLDGPFRRLQGKWQFQALGDAACKVTLELEYRFAAGLLGKAIAPVFEQVAGSLIDAFARRASQIHGDVDG